MRHATCLGREAGAVKLDKDVVVNPLGGESVVSRLLSEAVNPGSESCCVAVGGLPGCESSALGCEACCREGREASALGCEAGMPERRHAGIPRT